MYYKRSYTKYTKYTYKDVIKHKNITHQEIQMESIAYQPEIDMKQREIQILQVEKM